MITERQLDDLLLRIRRDSDALMARLNRQAARREAGRRGARQREALTRGLPSGAHSGRAS